MDRLLTSRGKHPHGIVNLVALIQTRGPTAMVLQVQHCAIGRSHQLGLGPGVSPRKRQQLIKPVMASASAQGELKGLALRPATWHEVPSIFKGVLQERMNPLIGLNPADFTAAERDGQLVGFGRIKPLEPGAVELTSLVVLREHRGSGIGSAIIRSLCASAGSQDVYLTTIGRRVGMYERRGFQEVPQCEIPGSLLFEFRAGTVVANLVAKDRLAVLRWRAGAKTAA